MGIAKTMALIYPPTSPNNRNLMLGSLTPDHYTDTCPNLNKFRLTHQGRAGPVVEKFRPAVTPVTKLGLFYFV